MISVLGEFARWITETSRFWSFGAAFVSMATAIWKHVQLKQIGARQKATAEALLAASDEIKELKLELERLRRSDPAHCLVASEREERNGNAIKSHSIVVQWIKNERDTLHALFLRASLLSLDLSDLPIENDTVNAASDYATVARALKASDRISVRLIEELRAIKAMQTLKNADPNSVQIEELAYPTEIAITVDEQTAVKTIELLCAASDKHSREGRWLIAERLAARAWLLAKTKVGPISYATVLAGAAWAKALVNAGQPLLALEKLGETRNALGLLAPQNVAGQLDLQFHEAEALYLSENLKQALEILDSVIPKRIEFEPLGLNTAQNFLLRARVHQALEHVDQAISDIKEADERNRNQDLPFRVAIAQAGARAVRSQQRGSTAAVDAARRVLELAASGSLAYSSSHFKSLIEYGKCLAESGNSEQAIKSLSNTNQIMETLGWGGHPMHKLLNRYLDELNNRPQKSS